MKTLTLLTSGTNASAGLIRVGACHSRLFPYAILRTERWILRLKEIRLFSVARYGTNLPPLMHFQPKGRDVSDSEPPLTDRKSS